LAIAEFAGKMVAWFGTSLHFADAAVERRFLLQHFAVTYWQVRRHLDYVLRTFLLFLLMCAPFQIPLHRCLTPSAVLLLPWAHQDLGACVLLVLAAVFSIIRNALIATPSSNDEPSSCSSSTQNIMLFPTYYIPSQLVLMALIGRDGYVLIRGPLSVFVRVFFALGLGFSMRLECCRWCAQLWQHRVLLVSLSCMITPVPLVWFAAGGLLGWGTAGLDYCSPGGCSSTWRCLWAVPALHHHRYQAISHWHCLACTRDAPPRGLEENPARPGDHQQPEAFL
jgi:hypothetical protein